MPNLKLGESLAVGLVSERVWKLLGERGEDGSSGSGGIIGGSGGLLAETGAGFWPKILPGISQTVFIGNCVRKVLIFLFWFLNLDLVFTGLTLYICNNILVNTIYLPNFYSFL